MTEEEYRQRYLQPLLDHTEGCRQCLAWSEHTCDEDEPCPDRCNERCAKGKVLAHDEYEAWRARWKRIAAEA